MVLDTNVYISAILFGGMAEKVLERLSQQGSFIFISPFILDEVERVLREKFGWQEMQIRVALDDLRERTTLVVPDEGVDVITAKEDDNRILECATAANAALLISGDRKHILPLKTFRGIKIVSPGEFLRYT